MSSRYLSYDARSLSSRYLLYETNINKGNTDFGHVVTINDNGTVNVSLTGFMLEYSWNDDVGQDEAYTYNSEQLWDESEDGGLFINYLYTTNNWGSSTVLYGVKTATNYVPRIGDLVYIVWENGDLVAYSSVKNENVQYYNEVPFVSIIKPEDPDKNQPVDSYGLNPEYIKFYPNKCYNSSFEVFDSSTFKPDYWDTSGVVSPDAEFDNTYSLKLAPGQYAEQKEDKDGIGLADTNWWSWCRDTRISFRVKGRGGRVRVSVTIGGVAQPLWRWEKDVNGNDIRSSIQDYLDFDAGEDWHKGLRTFSVSPPSGGKMKLRFDNIGNVDVYIDAVIIEPDWTGRWPSPYTHGPRSVKTVWYSLAGNRNLWVQADPPTAENVGDLWVDISS